MCTARVMKTDSRRCLEADYSHFSVSECAFVVEGILVVPDFPECPPDWPETRASFDRLAQVSPNGNDRPAAARRSRRTRGRAHTRSLTMHLARQPPISLLAAVTPEKLCVHARKCTRFRKLVRALNNSAFKLEAYTWKAGRRELKRDKVMASSPRAFIFTERTRPKLIVALGRTFFVRECRTLIQVRTKALDASERRDPNQEMARGTWSYASHSGFSRGCCCCCGQGIGRRGAHSSPSGMDVNAA